MGFRKLLAFLVAVVAIDLNAADMPDPLKNPESPVMLAGDWLPGDPDRIDHLKLPKVPEQHAVISDVRDRGGKWVHQHAYLAHHDGRYWAMWSDGPGLPRPGLSPEKHRNLVPGHDRPGTRVSYATSRDGLNWSKPGDLSGPPLIDGYGWIARGLWVRGGELLALASHFNAPGYAGLGLSLQGFRWNGGKWVAHGTVLDDAMNNFPPKKLPSGEWMMTRRDHQRQVSVMIGGLKAFDDWRINPLASYDGKGRPEEPYWYVLPDGKSIVGLIRDNGGSRRLLRTYSTDNGKTWTKIVRTDFPDATSKFFVHRTSRGYYVMVSNSNPRRRDPLTLAVSKDGLVFTKLFWLVGGRHIDYPHIIEHDGHLLVAFSGAKQTMEVMKVSLDELERMEMPASVALSKPMPVVRRAQQPPSHWIDLGDEGKTLFVSAEMTVPHRGMRAEFHLATASGQKRVTVGFDEEGKLIGRLYQVEEQAMTYPVGQTFNIVVRVRSHHRKPDELHIRMNSGDWALVNRKGSSAANLARVIVDAPEGSVGKLKVATTENGLEVAAPMRP